jgi:hypothetical protein
MAGYPEFDLLEAGFEAVLELKKKLPVLWGVLHVYKHAHKLIEVDRPTVLPFPPNGLGFKRGCAEFFP